MIGFSNCYSSGSFEWVCHRFTKRVHLSCAVFRETKATATLHLLTTCATAWAIAISIGEHGRVLEMPVFLFFFFLAHLSSPVLFAGYASYVPGALLGTEGGFFVTRVSSKSISSPLFTLSSGGVTPYWFSTAVDLGMLKQHRYL